MSLSSVPSRPARVRRTLAGVLVSVSLLAACGGSSSTAAKATTTTVDAAAAKAALTARLLTPADLATGDALDAGWEPGDVSKGVDIKLPACVQEAPGAQATTGAEIRLVTKNNLHLPSLQEDLSSFAPGGAATELATATKRLDACVPAFVFQGAPATGAIQRLPFTVAGATALAWRTTVTIAGAGVSITNVHLVKGDTELALIHVDLGTPDIAVLQAFATKALAKLA